MMSAPAQVHTYGPKCRLTPVAHPTPTGQDNDDPLSPGTIAGASDARTTRGQIRPFSLGDNNALEKAWLSFLSEDNSFWFGTWPQNMAESMGGYFRHP
ncbi:hypothetical protein CGGC5_v008929 [Colletotrichum fructicola Nara gc5]|uniref:Uncharacterized protein n=1 Tax=Colletotrichum fructicola (strain Nara gc5) TaxID=1213859 RepID=A0A7J6IXY6_COLFN|nr:hypothetical protein CGGC5_v008929 [Colletotrichum fructicola Nara gc5]